MELQTNCAHHAYNTYGITVPYSFANNYMPICPADIKFAIHQGIFCKEAIEDYAVDMLEQNIGDSDALVDLILNYRDMSPEELDSALDALQEVQCDETPPMKFCDLLLTWVYENQSQYSNPLLVAEIIYEDYDTPKEVSKFIRYMPMQEEMLDSKELCEQRLMRHWGEYVKLRTAYWEEQMK